jgi:hypothetical protein
MWFTICFEKSSCPFELEQIHHFPLGATRIRDVRDSVSADASLLLCQTHSRTANHLSPSTASAAASTLSCKMKLMRWRAVSLSQRKQGKRRKGGQKGHYKVLLWCIGHQMEIVHSTVCSQAQEGACVWSGFLWLAWPLTHILKSNSILGGDWGQPQCMFNFSRAMNKW